MVRLMRNQRMIQVANLLVGVERIRSPSPAPLPRRESPSRRTVVEKEIDIEVDRRYVPSTACIGNGINMYGQEFQRKPGVSQR